ncbi:PorT family protein [Pontibacter sp. FD36]|uniref:porin family protein n=1 Tax=Pontibacter sp. FD36 TaxID=2789860 RepID=UPI0018A90013|nr:porin family protein [Pontibacter sp. FD36]MBF8962898.1 PorT family protein [Pontibacter sp. FD36]
MKIKFLLTLLFAVGMAFTSMAQSVSFGPRVGATFSKVSLSDGDGDELEDELKYTPGLQVGVVANFNVSELLSIQPELLFIQKGYKFGDSDAYLKGTSNYIEVPVLAKITFGSEQVKGFVTGGPTVGYLASGKMSMKYDGNKGSDSYEFEDEDNRMELGASFGVGLGYNLGAGALNLDVRYGLGLTSLYEVESGESKSRNRVLGVSVAYLFGGK